MALVERSLFFDSVGEDEREYDSADFAQFFGMMFKTGVYYAGEPLERQLMVSADGLSMNLNITKGKALIRGRLYILEEPGSIVVPISQTDLYYRVVARLSLATSDRKIVLTLKPGTAASPPELQRDESVWEIAIATVYVHASQAYISASDITDTRGDPELCGWVTLNGILPSGHFFGDGSDGDAVISANTALPCEVDGDYVIKQYNTLTVNAGVTLTTQNRCNGLILYVRGDCTINGTIDMSRKAAVGIADYPPHPIFAKDKNGKALKFNAMLGQLFTPLKGGAGGRGGSSAFTQANSGQNGGRGRTTGGGVGGYGASYGVPAVEKADVPNTDRFWGFFLGTNAIKRYVAATSRFPGVEPSTTTGGTNSTYSRGAAIGGGISGCCRGFGGWGGSDISDADTEAAGGLVLIICGGVLRTGQSGRILADGGKGMDYEFRDGGSGGMFNGGAGGGSGGGIAALYYLTYMLNEGVIRADGGAGGAYLGSPQSPGTSGTAGSVGTVHIQRIEPLEP